MLPSAPTSHQLLVQALRSSQSSTFFEGLMVLAKAPQMSLQRSPGPRSSPPKMALSLWLVWMSTDQCRTQREATVPPSLSHRRPLLVSFDAAGGEDSGLCPLAQPSSAVSHLLYDFELVFFICAPVTSSVKWEQQPLLFLLLGLL